ncbi:MAG: DNA recombination protein RmuC, partial [Halobacteriovoraceae bacterium]|nr:DNA recombination protein RmuC [Halobacteriovoraceae bacterium]
MNEVILLLIPMTLVSAIIFFFRKNSNLTEKYINAKSEISSLKTENTILKEHWQTLKELKEKNELEFNTLASKILNEKTKALSEHSQKGIRETLGPLEKQLYSFEKQVNDKYMEESKERHALKKEIERLVEIGGRMAHETDSLTETLRGNSKVQGDWGELVLERILEDSGLRKGFEYKLQSSHLNADGYRLRPDVIINLPEKKHVIVDSKVSLKAYDLYRHTEDGEIKKKALGDFLKSIDRHLQDLSEKHYSKLKGITSPEIVFMFVPIEPAYLLAMQTDRDLSARAFKKGVAIVTATTLLTSLKTVASIWRLEKQNKNAQKIAREGGRLYDKFAGFLEDFDKIGMSMDTTRKQYDAAMGKLKLGPGNIFKKIEKLKELGISPNKNIESR